MVFCGFLVEDGCQLVRPNPLDVKFDTCGPVSFLHDYMVLNVFPLNLATFEHSLRQAIEEFWLVHFHQKNNIYNHGNLKGTSPMPTPQEMAGLIKGLSTTIIP